MANPERDRKHRESVRLLIEAGARVVPGIDLYGTNPVDELVTLTELGLSRDDALVAATRGAAEMLGLEKEIGTVEVGKRADLVVVDGDPSRDLEALRRVRWTFHDGIRYQSEQLSGVVGSSTTIAA
jgi:imidazolonepropionase-like amidohydrolase